MRIMGYNGSPKSLTLGIILSLFPNIHRVYSILYIFNIIGTDIRFLYDSALTGTFNFQQLNNDESSCAVSSFLFVIITLSSPYYSTTAASHYRIYLFNLFNRIEIQLLLLDFH